MNQITSASAPIVAVFESASSIRIIMINGEPWLVAVDIAKALNFRDASNMVRMLDEDEKGTRPVSTPGGSQELTVISESGLYHAVLKSRKPEAKTFRKWVTSEVLPSIRKTGSYSVTDSCQDLDGMQPIDEERLLAMKARVSRIARMFLTMTPQKVSTLIYGRIKSTFRVSRIDDIPAYAVGYADAIISRVEVLASANYSRLKRDEPKMLFDLNLTEGA